MSKKQFRSFLRNLSRLTALIFVTWMTIGQYPHKVAPAEHPLEIKQLSPAELVLDAPVSAGALTQFVSHSVSFDWSQVEIIPDIPGLMTMLTDERFHHFVERNTYYFFLSAKAP